MSEAMNLNELRQRVRRMRGLGRMIKDAVEVCADFECLDFTHPDYAEDWADVRELDRALQRVGRLLVERRFSEAGACEPDEGEHCGICWRCDEAKLRCCVSGCNLVMVEQLGSEDPRFICPVHG